ncbi:MAG: flavin-dependent oxidoreductase [Rhodospirillaceae bacterium]|nr:flavin-dependent oxidoreductase [Rhodospirillaceae bacterium]
MDVAIAGAGIGGLAAALSLAKAGLDVRVFESVREIRPLGVGINLLPHSVRHLFELGLQPALDATGIRTSELRYTTTRGETIWREPRGLEAGYRWPQFSIHRGRLQGLLLAAVRDRLGTDAVLLDHAATSVETRADRAILTAGEETVEARLVIAADGIHSALRARHYADEGPPIWNGAILWRATTEAVPYLDGRTMCMCGHEKQKFVCYPITPAGSDGRATINWIAERRFPTDRAWRREDWNRSGDLKEFLPHFADWRFPWLDVPALIEGAAAVYEYPMVDREPLPRWTFGRMTLLGYAAHPMYPIGSNGASQAILDARALAGATMRHGPTPEALAAYESERRPKTSGIVLANRRNGPEQVMQIVEERAPGGFSELNAIISHDELAGIASTYKKLAGFDPAILNAEPDLYR